MATTAEDVAVAQDWLLRRGCDGEVIEGTGVRWTQGGRAAPTLAFMIAMRLRMPDVVAGSTAGIVEVISACGRSPANRPATLFPTGRVTSSTARGRHALHAWRVERGAIGERLLALAALREGRLDVTPAHLAAYDRRLEQLARLEIVARSTESAPDSGALLDFAGGLLDGTAVTLLWQWLNDAQRAADVGRGVDFTLPRVLGLHPVSRLSIIP